MSEVLRAHGVTVRYGPSVAVDDVSLGVAAGEVLALVGESGCGKSSLARALVGLEPAEGTVSLNGTAVRLNDRRQRQAFSRQVQLIFQDPGAALDPRFTVADVLEEPLVLHGLQRAPGPALEEVGLEPGVLGRRPAQLSTGQRQRVTLARALMTDPSVLIADEPISALDASVQATVLELLRSLVQRRRLALLLVTHELTAVAALASRVAVMYAGRIVEHGPVAEVFASPKHRYTVALLAAARTLQPIAGEAPALGQRPFGCAFAPRCPASTEACRRAVPPLVGAAHGWACVHPA